MAKDEVELSLSQEELEALKGIVVDWINEGIVSPPYDPAVESVLKKLDVKVGDDRPDVAQTQTQEKISETAADKAR